MVGRGACVFCLLTVLLAGCSTAPRPVPPGAPEATEPAAGTATPPLPPRSETAPGGDAVASLLEDADAACADGDIDGGLAKLDRGLRIAPYSAGIYLAMARCHRGGGDADRAAAVAERGLAYCSGSQCRELRRFLKN